MTAPADLLLAYSEWLDGEGLVKPDHEVPSDSGGSYVVDDRPHDQLVAEFLESRPVAEPERLHPYWHGWLCAENAEEVAQRMRNVLDGQRFTMVAANSYSAETERYSAVDVRTTQRLTYPIKAEVDENCWVHIGWSTQDYSMGLSTRAKTPAEGREGRPHDYVQLVIEPRKIEIHHYAPARYRMLWTLAVEDHIDARLLEPEVLDKFRETWHIANDLGAEGDRVRLGMHAAIREARYE